MSGSPARILVVDDELGMREGCRRVLTAEGFEVETAEDGLAGLEVLTKRRDFAAALIDLKMPRMGGMELIEQIRKQDPDIVLLVITAYATFETAVEAIKRGAYGYIPKPFTPDELLLPVRNGLERRALALEARRLRQERADRLLEVAQERSQGHMIINCMADGVVVVNRDAQIVLKNAVADQLVPRLVGLPIPSPLSDLGQPRLQRLLEESLRASAGPVILSEEMFLDDRSCMVNAGPVVEPSGQTLGAIAVVRDITALKKIETAKSMFVTMVAHEIKSPLAAIEGYLDLLLSGAVGEEPRQVHEMVGKALTRARALREMVMELMDIVAMETGNRSLIRSPISLGDVMTAAVAAHREKAEERGIEVHLTTGSLDALPRVLADRSALTSVLSNLIDNAIKYTPRGGHVNVRVSTEGDYAKLLVEDDGIGMSDEECKRVFDEFYRAKNDFTANVPGTGLGLSLARRLVDLHQGKITVESEPGKGSRFLVWLPLTGQIR